MSFFDQLKRSWAIVKKDLFNYYLKAPVVIFGIVTPFFLFFAFFLGRKLSIEFLIPGLLGMVLFFAGSSIGPIIAPWETRMKTFERLISAPISLWAIILGDVIASFLLGLFITFFVLLVSVILLGIGIIDITLILGTIIGAFCFSSLGLLISAPPTDKPSDTMMLSTFIKFPLLFISGVFISISEMGKWAIASYISPLTYYIDLVRNSVQGISHFNSAANLAILFGFGVLFFIIAIKWHKKSLSKRF